MYTAAILFAFLLVAAWTDLTTHKIHNGTTYTGMLVAFAANYFELGSAGLEDSLKGFVLCGSLMLVSYVLFAVGGGDVKLLAMIGAFLGLERGIETLLWTFVIGGVAGLSILIWRLGFTTAIARAIRVVLSTLSLGTVTPLAPAEREQLQPPLYFAPAALLAAAIVVLRLV